jgi:acyl-coenzyme A thioesterase PaaI-like protein
MTVDSKINFIRPARGRLVRARGRVVRAGHSLTVARVDVRALVLEAKSACALLLATVLRVDA